MVSYKEIKSRVQKLWPDCKNIWLSDNEYYYPVFDQVNVAIAADHTERLSFRNYLFDCDDYALQLSASISKYVGQYLTPPAPWPFGQITGRKFNGKKDSHTCCICVLEERVLLIEPQTDFIWDASTDRDDPYFIKVP